VSGSNPARGLAPARAARPIEARERIHVIGAAGAGASAAALLAHAAGARVTACDPGAPSPYTPALEAVGIAIATAHDPAHVVDAAGAGIVSRIGVTKALTSVDPDHPELVAARAAGVPVEAWQQVVADAAASHRGTLVAVSGTHGKSTSSGWLVHVLLGAGRDPAAFVGALMPADAGSPPSTARWGAGDVFVVEADEYAGNFDPYRPALAVILNAEWDHPDVFADRAAVVSAFEAWVRSPGAEGRRVVVNVGDEGAHAVADRLRDLGSRLTTLAPADLETTAASTPREAADVRWRLTDGVLALEGLRAGPVAARLRLPGRHYASDAAAVAAAADLLGVEAGAIARGLETFGGVGRRLEVVGDPRGVLVIDDYAHHPTAIRATIAALRERHPERRLWAVHEPLTFHRTAAMLDALADALADADEAVIADIWPGRDPDTSIASARQLAAAVTARTGRDVAAPGSPESTAASLVPRVRAGDVVLVMGGGRSYVIAHDLVERLSGAERG
jgi:UDP-N-acetylmuramate--alanine ligase